MEKNKDINQGKKSEALQLEKLYLSTCEKLAVYAFEATSRQQQMNILAQQVTTNSVRNLYSGFTSITALHQE